MRAQGAHQALGHDPEQGGAQQVIGDAQFQQAGDGAGRVVGVQGGEHQVAGEGGLDGHLGGFQVADLADHDDVRVLPQQGAHAAGEGQVDVVLHLHLVEGRLDHLDRVFDGADVHLLGRQLFERGVEGGGLA
ncbi:hypothetical protein D3C81_1596830 [compost metagenome]